MIYSLLILWIQNQKGDTPLIVYILLRNRETKKNIKWCNKK